MPVRKGFYATVRDLQNEVADVRDGGVSRGSSWCVDGLTGSDTLNDGTSWRAPYKTMAKAFTRVASGDRIYVRNGIYENLVGPRITDISIIGVSTKPRHDKPAATALADVERGAAAWRTASGVTDEPLLVIRAQGWRIKNLLVAGGSGAPCFEGTRTAETATQEDASHLELIGCRFASGQYAFLQTGGVGHVGIYDCDFAGATVAALGSATGEGIAFPIRWQVIGNRFTPDLSGAAGNASHIIAPLLAAIIERNVFGKVVSTAKYIDLTGGSDNVVAHNIMAGVYDTADYVAGTGDLWFQNAAAVVAVTAPDGMSLAAPAAP